MWQSYDGCPIFFQGETPRECGEIGRSLAPRRVALTRSPPPPRVQVVVVDKLDYCANLNNLKSVAGLSNFKFVKGDIGSVRATTKSDWPR
jgi:hypothetical protein